MAVSPTSPVTWRVCAEGLSMASGSVAAGILTKEYQMASFEALRQLAKPLEAKLEAEDKATWPQFSDSTGIVFSLPVEVLSPAKDVSLLKKVQVRELAINAWSPGLCIVGVLVSRALKLKEAAAMVLEDEAGNGITVLLYNTILSTTTESEVEAAFPRGAKVVIKEPYLMSNGPVAGCCVVLGNPQALSILSYGVPGELSEDPAYLRQLANREFKQGHLELSVALYSRSIELSRDQDETVLAYSNRAQAWLNLGGFEKALQDTNEALELSPMHAKTAYRKTKALLGLGLYEQACEWFKRVLEIEPSSLVRSSYEQARLFREQSVHGKYDISGYLVGGCNKETAPEVAEYVGPVEVRTSDGKGRGLFVTRDVQAGELLLVSNATVLVHEDRELTRKRDCLNKLVRACIASPRTLAQVHARASSEVPSMVLFRPNQELGQVASPDVAVDVLRIQEKPGVLSNSKKRWGVWTLPSFVNHSCTPSVSYFYVGYKALFVFAAKDLKAGDEVLRTYCSGFNPCHARGCLEKGFRCDRCSFEQQLHLGSVEEMLRAAENKAEKHGPQFAGELVDVALKVEGVIQKRKLTLQQAAWLRTSYAAAYFAYYGWYRTTAGVVNVAGLPPHRVFFEGVRATQPGQETLVLLARCFKFTAQELLEYGPEVSKYLSELIKYLEDEVLSRYGTKDEAVVDAILGHVSAGNKML